jgi:hypothetical protein
MPANDDRHGPKSRRTLVKIISTAAAAIGSLALAACTSTTTSAPVPVTPVAAAGTSAGSAGTLNIARRVIHLAGTAPPQGQGRVKEKRAQPESAAPVLPRKSGSA